METCIYGQSSEGWQVNSALRPNYRRARALALEIEVSRNILEEAKGDPSYTDDQIGEFSDELNHLENEFFLTGVTSEYEL